MKRLTKSLFVLSLIFNVILGFVVYYQNRRIEMVSPAMNFNMLLSNMVELEAAITYQMHEDWNHASHPIEKLNDVKQGIAVTIHTGRQLGTLSQQDESLLWNLYYTLKKYPDDSGFPNVQLKNDDKIKLITLRDRLRGIGWSMNTSYSTSWNDAMDKIKELLIDLQTPSTTTL